MEIVDMLTMASPTTHRFYNRYYQSSYGTQAGTWLFNTVKSVAGSNSAITVSQFAHSFNQPSIIAKVPGSTANLGTILLPFNFFFPFFSKTSTVNLL